jgi:hypothetical protein
MAEQSKYGWPYNGDTTHPAHGLLQKEISKE